MDDRQKLRRTLLLILIGFILLLYLLGAASLWARHRFLNEAPLFGVATVNEKTMNEFADMFDKEQYQVIMI